MTEVHSANRKYISEGQQPLCERKLPPSVKQREILGFHRIKLEIPLTR